MKNKKHIIDCLRGKNPVRDLILVEKRIPCAYAVPLGTEYSANFLSLTEHPIWLVIGLFTNILFLTGLSKPLQVDYFTSHNMVINHSVFRFYLKPKPAPFAFFAFHVQCRSVFF